MSRVMKKAKQKVMVLVGVGLLSTGTAVYAIPNAPLQESVSEKVREVLTQEAVMTTEAQPATHIKLIVDGEVYPLQEPMLEENGRIFLPLQAISTLLELNTDYIGKEKVVIISNDHTYLELPLGYNQAVKDKSLILPIDKGNKNTRIFTYNSRTYLPVRFISENLGIEISYSNQTVTINTGKGDTVTPKPEQPKPEKPSDGLYDLSGINPSDPTNSLNLQALQDGRSLYNAPKTPLSQLLSLIHI